jgi:hypothetical protein
MQAHSLAGSAFHTFPRSEPVPLFPLDSSLLPSTLIGAFGLPFPRFDQCDAFAPGCAVPPAFNTPLPFTVRTGFRSY